MAPFSNFISFIFLTTLLLPLQINARESQFFSKVTHANNNAKETELPNRERPVNKPEQEQPPFIPETENSYGLYGHETTQLPSTTPTTTTTTNYKPHKTEFEDTSKYSNNKYYNYDNDAYNTNNNQNEFSNTRLTGTGYSSNNNNYYNKDAYGGYQNELSDTKYTEGGYNSMGNQKKYNNQMYYNNNAGNEKYTYNNNAANNRYNAERQGMSDTRFLEGGRYYFDLESEKYNTNLHGEAYRGVNNENRYNNYNYHNQGGRHGNYNAYQNQEEFEDELDDSEP